MLQGPGKDVRGLTLVPNLVVPVNVMVAPDLTSLRSSVTPAGTVSELTVMVEQDDTSVPLVYVPDRVQLEDSASATS